MAERPRSLECDFEDCDADAGQYQVSYPDGLLSVDLCDDHAAPLRALQDQVPHTCFVRLPSNGRRLRTGFRKTTMQEIEDLKQ